MQNCSNGLFSYDIKYGDTLYILAERFNTTIEEIIDANPGINPSNLQTGQIIWIPCTDDLLQSIEVNNNVLLLNNLFRTLWEQHIAWSRMVMMGIVYGLQESDLSLTRLLRNPIDFEKVFAVYYGNDIARKVALLFTKHLLITVEIIKAIKVKNEEKLKLENSKWYNNVDDIAFFFAGINPYWTIEEWKELLKDHIELIKAEVSYFLGENYDNNALIYDDMEKQALEIADLMTVGIVEQFPGSFYD